VQLYLQVFAIEFVTFAIDFILFVVKFIAFAIEFGTFAIFFLFLQLNSSLLHVTRLAAAVNTAAAA